MKVKLISDGGYFTETLIVGLEVEVSRVEINGSGDKLYEIPATELGGDLNNFDPNETYPFFDYEVEVISE